MDAFLSSEAVVHSFSVWHSFIAVATTMPFIPFNAITLLSLPPKERSSTGSKPNVLQADSKRLTVSLFKSVSYATILLTKETSVEAPNF